MIVCAKILCIVLNSLLVPESQIARWFYNYIAKILIIINVDKIVSNFFLSCGKEDCVAAAFVGFQTTHVFGELNARHQLQPKSSLRHHTALKRPSQ